jgi:uncharacterized membrane protein YeaQ/YmgE (transglycosylase-associated protein family)
VDLGFNWLMSQESFMILTSKKGSNMLLAAVIIGTVAGTFIGGYLVEDEGPQGELAMIAFGLIGLIFGIVAFSLLGLL